MDSLIEYFLEFSISNPLDINITIASHREHRDLRTDETNRDKQTKKHAEPTDNWTYPPDSPGPSRHDTDEHHR